MSLAVAKSFERHQCPTQEKNNMSPKHIISVLGSKRHLRAGKRSHVSLGCILAKDSLLGFVHLFDGVCSVFLKSKIKSKKKMNK